MRLLYQVRRDVALRTLYRPLSKVTPLMVAIILLSAAVLPKTSEGQSDQKPAEVTAGDDKDPARSEQMSGVDVASLVREANANGGAMLDRMLEYTYTLKKIRRVLNGDGKVLNERVDTFEAYPVRGQHVLIQLTSDGAPLLGSHVAEERRRAGQSLVRADDEEKKQGDRVEAVPDKKRGYLAAGISGIHRSKYASVTIDISEILRSCEFSSPRAARLGEREMIALSFRPPADHSFPLNKKYISRIAGTIWIDAAERVVARLEAWVAVASPDARHEQGPVLIYEQARQPSGAWFPILIRLNTRGDESIANGLNWDVVFELSEYHHFTSRAEEVKIKEADRPRPHN